MFKFILCVLFSVTALAPLSSHASEAAVCKDVFGQHEAHHKDPHAHHKSDTDFQHFAHLEAELRSAIGLLPKSLTKDLLKALENLKRSGIEMHNLREWSKLLRQAIEQLPKMRAFIESLPKGQRAYFLRIYAASLSALIKFPQAFFKNQGDRDWARYASILRHIAEFNPDAAKFSLYKIKRIIEGRYSLREFIRCR